MILYKQHILGSFNGFITTKSGSTIESVVTQTIIGETKDDYIIRIIESEIPYWDEMGRYTASMCSAVGIHKSRLINWLTTQLNLF